MKLDVMLFGLGIALVVTFLAGAWCIISYIGAWIL